MALETDSTRRQFLAALGATALASAQQSRPVNVVFILTDDQGPWAINAGGAGDCDALLTPNLARLAREGTRFPNAFVSTPVCSASRMTYLTGRIPSQHGVQDWLPPQECLGPEARNFIDGQPTISEALVQQGYTAGLCGKWHLGADATPQAGFSYWSTVPGGGGTFRNPRFVKNGETIRREGFKTDLLGDDALEFLDLNKDRPFFLYLSFFAPHTPFDFQAQRYRDLYAGSDFPCSPDEPVHPNHMRFMFDRISGHLVDFGNEQSKHAYAALISGLDANVGRVLDKLEELGLRENTVVIFTSDHGFHTGHKGIWGKGNGTVPFNLLERSVKVPLIWSQPGSIPVDVERLQLVSSYDLLPTLFDYLGQQAPPDERRMGRSYAQILHGQQPSWDDAVFFEYEYVRGVRTPHLKLVERGEQWESALYDLKNDPEETSNVIGDPQYAASLTSLRQRLNRFFDDAGAPPIDQWRSTTRQVLPTYRAHRDR